jgi:uncharacterized protein (TIGR02301 family)
MRFRLTALAVLALTLVASPFIAAPARAQTTGPSLEDNLARLSEIMGSLHYLRGICKGNEGDRWRKEMQNLLDTEGTTPDRKARMTANFNRGFGNFQQTYRTCTPAAELAIKRYLDEGTRLARDITARYSN